MSAARALHPRRAPHRPGPGPMPAGLVRAMDIDVRRRIQGLLAGDFRSATLGDGTELAQVRAYVPGDDVRQIEWNVTARTNEVHVRTHLAEKALTTWLILDASPSMSFGTADRRKADVAEGISLAVGHVATRRANRIGVMTFGAPRDALTRPSQGRAGLLTLLTALRRIDEGATPASTDAASSLDAALRRAAGIIRSRSVIVVVSDFRGRIDWDRSLGRLGHRHDVLAIEVVDPREDALVDIGDVLLVDPETGRQVRVDTRDRVLRRRFEAAAAGERARVRGALRSAGAAAVTVSTAGDWLRVFATFLARRKLLA